MKRNSLKNKREKKNKTPTYETKAIPRVLTGDLFRETRVSSPGEAGIFSQRPWDGGGRWVGGKQHA